MSEGSSEQEDSYMSSMIRRIKRQNQSLVRRANRPLPFIIAEFSPELNLCPACRQVCGPFIDLDCLIEHAFAHSLKPLRRDNGEQRTTVIRCRRDAAFEHATLHREHPTAGES
jgi:hypothetical protein